MNEVKDHTENILYSIQNEIKYDNLTIKIDRTKIIEDIEKKIKKNQVIIISGDGGSGKTALIKEFYNKTKNTTPVYIFKAAEFNNIDSKTIFNKFGEYTLTDFIEIHKSEKNKIIVIDSAEKLSDLDNHEPFKHFLSALLKNSWKMIFTTRYNYLDDLQFQIVELYRLSSQVINITNLTVEELIALSKKYNFQLPDEKRLQSLIQNLFYLDEYLQNYQSFNNTINFNFFKEIIWKKKIQNSTLKKNNIHIQREKCFLDLVKVKCITGLFYVNPENLPDNILPKLEADEIIKYDLNHGGYFITHDIYEEWALEKIIEKEFRISE